MTPADQIRYQKNLAWLADNQADLANHYGVSLRQALLEIDFYAAIEAVYVRLTFANGSTIDLPIPGTAPETVIREYQIGEVKCSPPLPTSNA